MECTINKEALVKALTPAQMVAERRNTRPILACVNIEISDGGKAIFTATDLEVGVRAQIDASVSKAGAIALNAKKLFEIVREFRGEDISLSLGEGNRVEISSNGSHFSIMGLDSEEFPGLPDFDESGFLSLKASDLSEMVDMTSYAVSTDDTRYQITGGYLHPAQDGKSLVMVATDGHRLSRVVREIEGGAALVAADGEESATEDLPKGIIVPRKGLSELSKLLEEVGDSEISIGIHEGFMVARTEDATLSMRLLDGEYPDYQRVIPDEQPTFVEVPRERLSAILRMASLISSEKLRAVKISVGDGNLTVSASNPELGDFEESIEAPSEGESVEVGLNARYLLDILGVLNTENVRLGFGTSSSASTVSIPGDPGFIGVVMPMRIGP